jgi:hypothetical protein
MLLKMTTKMFHKPIPEDIALMMFSHVGLKSIHDSSWFRRKDVELALQKIVDDLPLIEPYYLPHKKFYVMREMTAPRILCIFRHIAKCFGLKIELMEKGRYGEKQFYYRLVNPSGFDCGMTVSFD